MADNNIQNLAAYDPFADTGDADELKLAGYIREFNVLQRIYEYTQYHKDIRIQQRNGRKTLTTVQGLPADLDQKKILKAFKKVCFILPWGFLGVSIRKRRNLIKEGICVQWDSCPRRGNG
jgi:translation initiation factor SUI1